MCWSGQASATLATVGILSTCYAAYKKEPPVLWMTLGYFSLMELLQAFTYTVINRCDIPSNQIATLLGYLHITFQPFFINALSLYFINQRVARKIAPAVYGACFFGAIFMLIQLYPFEWAGKCDPSRPLCGEVLCSVRGNWHIAWLVPTNGIGNALARTQLPFIDSGFTGYVLAAFFLPMLYGSWRCTAYHFTFGTFLASVSTDNINEWPAIWCLFSIGLLLVVVKTPIRRWLYVNSWPLWPRSWTGDTVPKSPVSPAPLLESEPKPSPSFVK
jgi:hypothetical protein